MTEQNNKPDEGHSRFAFDQSHGLPIDHDRRAFRAALGRFPTGVAVVTAQGAEGQPIGITINSFSSVSLEPPLVLWSVDHQASRAADFIRAEHFVISVMAEDQGQLARQFAGPEDKRFQDGRFHHVEWHPLGEDIPIPEGAVAVFLCRKYADYPGGDHQIIVGQVEQVISRTANALLFHDGVLRPLA
ncbi:MULTISPECIES: flavin reductase family protein [unclassified Iodidimonas]|jgi:flavin reductase (DIM6/NTAB) family NADH-FMN oxidoreductase RutF|uniref:flavin reductase family protein n=1 Tax=unclassified Iodidimonas TaxID=2626145 RepID=UPI002482C8D2|nr:MULTISPECIES: flavin reductase family protein [unclassified Iodidimonas]